MKVLLASIWITYCIIHSLLADDRVKERVRERTGPHFRYYRLAYNFLSLVLLIPPLAVERTLDSLLFDPSPLITVFRGILFLSSVALFWAGARSYDMGEFLGISQARGEREKPALKRDGVLSLVRHPWYLGGLLFLWSRRLTEGTVVTNAVLSVYLVVGAHLEERKLLRAFGAEYERYREEVPMLIPRAGDLASLLKRFTRSGR